MEKNLKAAEEDMYPRLIKKIRLEVSVGNISAINLYEKFGFTKIEFLKDYYKYRQYKSNDAFRMVKELDT